MLCLISNTLPQLEQSFLHPQQFSVITSGYRPPATIISIFSYISTAPEKKNRSSNRLGTPLSQGVEKPEGPSALQPATEITHALSHTHASWTYNGNNLYVAWNIICLIFFDNMFKDNLFHKCYVPILYQN